MKWNRNKRARFLRWNEGEGDGADGANGGGDAGAASAASGAAATGGDDGGSLLDGVKADAVTGGEGKTGAEGGKADSEWLPEKYRVLKDDGTLDESASARKLADAHRSLEQKLGKAAALQAPASPDDYKLEAPKGADGEPLKGVDIEAFVADPLFKGIAKEAHEKGIPNEYMQFFVEKYLALAPSIVAQDQNLTAAEAKAELSKLWADDAAMNRNLSGVVKAINAFGGEAEDMPGSRDRLTKKYGRDPDFIAFSARIAEELKEDRTPTGSDGVGATSESDIESLMKGEAYWKASHPDHARVKAQVAAHFARTHGAKPR